MDNEEGSKFEARSGEESDGGSAVDVAAARPLEACEVIRSPLDSATSSLSPRSNCEDDPHGAITSEATKHSIHSSAHVRTDEVAPPSTGRTPKAKIKSSIAKGMKIDRRAIDVLCGRGIPIQNYHGNIRMHSIINKYRDRYQVARRKEKPALIRKVAAEISQGGARFLKRTKNDGWEVMDGEYAYEKVSHALRCVKSKTATEVLEDGIEHPGGQPSSTNMAPGDQREHGLGGSAAHFQRLPVPLTLQALSAAVNLPSGTFVLRSTRTVNGEGIGHAGGLGGTQLPGGPPAFSTMPQSSLSQRTNHYSSDLASRLAIPMSVSANGMYYAMAPQKAFSLGGTEVPGHTNSSALGTIGFGENILSTLWGGSEIVAPSLGQSTSGNFGGSVPRGVARSLVALSSANSLLPGIGDVLPPRGSGTHTQQHQLSDWLGNLQTPPTNTSSAPGTNLVARRHLTEGGRAEGVPNQSAPPTPSSGLLAGVRDFQQSQQGRAGTHQPTALLHSFSFQPLGHQDGAPLHRQLAGTIQPTPGNGPASPTTTSTSNFSKDPDDATSEGSLQRVGVKRKKSGQDAAV